MMVDIIKINRAPVLTLWTATVAQCLGFDWNEALTLGRAVAQLNVTRKPDSRLPPSGTVPEGTVPLLGFSVPVVMTEHGRRALSYGKPISPVTVETHLKRKFGVRLEDVHAAMAMLAPSRLNDGKHQAAYALYEQFRPSPPEGGRKLGRAGDFDLDKIRDLAR